jgi:sugar/nucleoside kinase (ribokinase family)
VTRPRSPAIVGIGCSTRDCTTDAPAKEIEDFLSRFGIRGPVRIGLGEPERLAHQRFAAAHGPVQWTAGGTIPNTLCAAAGARDERDLAIGTITWRGPAEYGDSVLADVSLAHMRDWGICVQPMYRRGFVREAYCLVDPVTREGRQVSIFERAAHIVGDPDCATADLIVMSVFDFLNADAGLLEHVRRCGQLALLIADWRPVTGIDSLRDRLQRVANLRFMLGHRRDFLEAGFCDALAQGFSPFLADVECVGTNGPQPVVWKGAGTLSASALPVEPVSGIAGNTLGAGDGYAGAFLASRLAGFSSTEAHGLASQQARGVMAHRLSHVPRSENLNRVFPSHVARQSAATTEGAFARRLHDSPGLVVTCCGQTGIDQIAAQAAQDFGIPCFAIMPEGRRTECRELGVGGPDRLDGVTVLELATPSYRFCTWANVFASDGTILLDFAGSEGSEETRRAAQWLARPVLELRRDAGPAVADVVRTWIDRFGVRVVNCAGTRMSLLDDDERSAAARILGRALVAAAAAIGRRDCGVDRAPPVSMQDAADPRTPMVLAAPNTAVSRNLIRTFLVETALLDTSEPVTATPAQLLWRLPSLGVEVVFARARDLPMALKRGWVDYAIFGDDIWLDDGQAATPLFPLGVDACGLVEVAGHQTLSDDPHRDRSYASAWPNLADSVLRRDGVLESPSVTPIGGCLEAWLSLGRIDSGLDTYRTGQTVSAHGLRITRRLGTVHSWLYRRAGAESLVHPLIIRFAEWLHGPIALPARRGHVE